MCLLIVVVFVGDRMFRVIVRLFRLSSIVLRIVMCMVLLCVILYFIGLCSCVWYCLGVVF